jgi:hypothetical protein
VRPYLLITLTMMGPNRVLRILVDPLRVDRDLMGSIGHELQHAVEVLSHRNIMSGSAMILLYKVRRVRRASRMTSYLRSSWIVAATVFCSSDGSRCSDSSKLFCERNAKMRPGTSQAPTRNPQINWRA